MQPWAAGYTAHCRIRILKVLTEREDEIYKLREDGATFCHIASKFNISKSRAHQLYAQVKFMKEVYDTLPPLGKLISNPTHIALKKSFKNQNILEYSRKILELGPYKILKIKKIGRVSLKEIASVFIYSWVHQKWE
jgi:hypothetical protein